MSSRKGIDLRAIQAQSCEWKICVRVGHSSDFIRPFLLAFKSLAWIQTVSQGQWTVIGDIKQETDLHFRKISLLAVDWKRKENT